MPVPSRTASATVRIPIDWGSLVPLRLRSKIIAEGVYAGMHRSVRRGPGVEFGGHRPYVPGDDLRFIDRRSLLRHDRLMVREFETETDRALWLVVDATASMSYRGPDAPGAKVAYAAVCAAGLARVALASGDPVGLVWVGGDGVRALPAMGGREAFERVLGTLEGAGAAGDASSDAQAMDRALMPIARRARAAPRCALLRPARPAPAPGHLRRPRLRRAHAGVVWVLDPAEAKLSFQATCACARSRVARWSRPTRMRCAPPTRGLRAIGDGWERELTARGGRFVACTTRRPGGRGAPGGALARVRARSVLASPPCCALLVAAPWSRTCCADAAEERPFPAAALVPATPPQARKRSALEDRALFSVRALAVIGLALLGATPFVRCSRVALNRQGGASVAMAVVLDDSLSMRAPLPGGEPGATSGPTRFQRARQGALELLDGTRSGDAVAVVMAGAPARVLVAATTNVATAREAIEAAEPSDRATDLDESVRLGRELLDALPQSDKRVVVFSDPRRRVRGGHRAGRPRAPWPPGCRWASWPASPRTAP